MYAQLSVVLVSTSHYSDGPINCETYVAEIPFAWAWFLRSNSLSFILKKDNVLNDIYVASWVILVITWQD